MNERTHIDLFSGIGGFALAARWAGFKTTAFCECEPYAQRVLRKHWPDVPIFEDVRTFPSNQFAGATLLTGGFPCQPFSVAGKRGGQADDRYLWPAMVSVIEAIRPDWIIGENVPGLVSLGLDRCSSDLEAQGYSVWPVIIPACAVGAFHRRDRVWIVAHREKPGLERTVSARPTCSNGRSSECGSDVANASRREDFGRGCGVVEKASCCWKGSNSSAIPRGGNGEYCVWADENEWFSKSGMGRIFNGLSYELDELGGINDEAITTKNNAKNRELAGKILFKMWEERKTAKTSPGLYIKRLRDCLPEVPHIDPHGSWIVGPWIEEDDEVRDMWKDFYAYGLPYSQDLLEKLLVRIRQAQLAKKMARVDRLKGLGNAIVPQVAYELMRFINQVDAGKQKQEAR